MWRFILVSLLAVVLAACGGNNEVNEKNQNNNVEANDSNDVNEPDTENDEPDAENNDLDVDSSWVDDLDIDTTTADGYDRMTFMDVFDAVVAEEADVDELLEVMKDPDFIKYIKFPIEDVETIDSASMMAGQLVDDDDEDEQTQDIEEFFKEYREGEAFIRFDLEDDPIRALSIPNDAVPITSILNFSSHVINVDAGEALVYDDKEIEYWDTYIKTVQSEEVADLSADDYRSWDDLSNLEQAYLPTFGKIAEQTYQLIAFEAFGEMESEAAEAIMDNFAWLGSELTMFPEPQSTLDVALYNNVQELQPIWAGLANYEEGDPEYKQLLEDLLSHNEQLALQLNLVLSKEHEEYIDADSYIDLYNNM